MAITNTQQAKQIMNEGKPMEDIGFSIVKPSKNGKRPGYRSAAFQSARSRSMSAGRSSPKSTGPSFSNQGSGEDNRQTYSAIQTQTGKVKGGGKGIGTDKRGNVVFEDDRPSQKAIDNARKFQEEQKQKREDFVKKLKSNKILRVPGAYNPLTAKLIEEIGYDAVYVSGGVMANDLGFPDIGLTTLQDVSTRSYLISRVTNLPTIVDIDTGFKSCKETIETFEEFGISAVHLEDQIERKRCGHLDNKELITTEAMVEKIKECVSAKKDNNFKIIARSDAKSVEGLDKMIDRCKAYIDAGAEIIFPEALQDEKEFEKVRKELSCYLLANMTEFGKSKLFNYKVLEQIGYNIVIYPVTTQRLAMKNVEDGLRDIYANGHQNNIIDKMQTRKRLYELVDYEKYNSLDEKIYNFSTEDHE